MTTTQTQIRRDTAANLTAATPAEGELGYDTTNKRLVVGDGSTAGGIKHASAKDVQNQAFEYATVGGTANAITLTHTPARTAYAAGQRSVFKATGTSSTAVTVNSDGLGTRNVKVMVNGALAALDSTRKIVSGGVYEPFDDGTQLQIKGLDAASGATKGTALTLNPYAGSATGSVAHGLGTTPNDVIAYLECITTEAGYAVGERVPMGGANCSWQGAGITISFDATYIYYNTNTTDLPDIVNKSGFGRQAITAANWKVVMTPLLWS